MKIPLILDCKPVVNKRGPEVLLGQGTWRLESDTSLFVVRLKSLQFSDEERQVTGEMLTLDESTIAQVELTGADKDKISIFAVKISNGPQPSTN